MVLRSIKLHPPSPSSLPIKIAFLHTTIQQHRKYKPKNRCNQIDVNKNPMYIDTSCYTPSPRIPFQLYYKNNGNEEGKGEGNERQRKITLSNGTESMLLEGKYYNIAISYPNTIVS